MIFHIRFRPSLFAKTFYLPLHLRCQYTMDVILEYSDEYLLDKVYNFLLPHPPVPSSLKSINTTALPESYSSSTTYHPSIAPTSLLPRDSIIRQSISLFTVALLGAYALYFIFCSLSYYYVYDRRLEHHPKFLKDQKRKEIISSVVAAPWIALMTLPWFVAEVRGYSMLYENVADYGWGYTALSVFMFLLFTDFGIYWVHRIEHHPAIYKHIHKPHHKWIGQLFLIFRESEGPVLIHRLFSTHPVRCACVPPRRRLRPVPSLPVRLLYQFLPLFSSALKAV